jgi:AraC family transcriptional regulator
MPQERRRLIRAIDHLEEHGDEAISLDDLGAVTCMSKYDFVRCFRALTGMTPHQYLIALRLRRAARHCG